MLGVLVIVGKKTLDECKSLAGRPVSPDHIAYCRTLERERRFPLWLGRGRGDRFPRAFIDPASDQRDLAGGERRPAQRHRRRHLARDSLHQQTSRRVARAKSRTAAAAFESVGMRGERESPRASLGAVAAQAPRRKNRVYVL